MQYVIRRQYRPSRWFVLATLGLMGLLTVGITTAYLMLLRHSAKDRIGVLTGSSMEPALRGPRAEIRCEQCDQRNSWAIDAWDSARPARCQFCREYLDTFEEPLVRAGEVVGYVPTVLLRRNSRGFSSARSDGLSIQRWDVVVVDQGDHPQVHGGQIKRVVGLPGESVSIQSGRILIDGEMVQPSIEQFMRQAVLMSSWDRKSTVEKLSEYISKLNCPIDNELPINAHDSHLRQVVEDIGIAFRFLKPQSDWNLKFHLRHGQKRVLVWLSCYENKAQVVLESEGAVFRNLGYVETWTPAWINVVVFNGRLVVLDQEKERLSCELPSLEEGLGWADLELVEPQELIDRCMVYRGLYYRGRSDSDTQEFPADQGWIVLGDNVSISEDSRFWEQSRIPMDGIRGVLRQNLTLMQGLIKQLP